MKPANIYALALAEFTPSSRGLVAGSTPSCDGGEEKAWVPAPSAGMTVELVDAVRMPFAVRREKEERAPPPSIMWRASSAAARQESHAFEQVQILLVLQQRAIEWRHQLLRAIPDL